MLPRIFIYLLGCKPLHCFLKIPSACKITANVVRLAVYGSSLANGRGKEIAILLVILDARVSCSLLCCCFHGFNLLLNLFFGLHLPFGRAKTNDYACFFLANISRFYTQSRIKKIFCVTVFAFRIFGKIFSP